MNAPEVMLLGLVVLETVVIGMLAWMWREAESDGREMKRLFDAAISLAKKNEEWLKKSAELNQRLFTHIKESGLPILKETP